MSAKWGSKWPGPNAVFSPRVKLSTCDLAGNAVGLATSGVGTGVWASANLAVFWPIIVEQAISITSLFLMNGATVAGNIDIGVYTADGTRIVSTGSTAQSGTSVEQIIAVTATNIGPGLYYIGVSLSDASTATVRAFSLTNAGMFRCAGVVQMASALPLPATATFATLTTTIVPNAGLIGTVINADRKIVVPATIHTASVLAGGATLGAQGVSLSSAVSATYQTSNKAFFIPFVLPIPITVTQLFALNGGTAGNNMDVGIYEKSGARIISSGSTAQSGTNNLQLFDIADTQIGPGEYYLAIAMNGTTGTLFRMSSTVVSQAIGVQQQTSAFALPATATFAAASNSYIPLIGLTTQAVI